MRLSLLEENGGIYFDLTTFVHDDLTWLSLENLWKSPIIQNRHPIHSSEPDVLITYWDIHGYKNVYPNEFKYMNNDAPGYESYFVAAKKNSSFIRDWKKKLRQYMEWDCPTIFYNMKDDDAYIGNFWYDCYYIVYYSLYDMLKVKQR